MTAKDNNGVTALDFAMKRGNTEIVSLLWDAKAPQGTGAASTAAKANTLVLNTNSTKDVRNAIESGVDFGAWPDRLVA